MIIGSLARNSQKTGAVNIRTVMIAPTVIQLE